MSFLPGGGLIQLMKEAVHSCARQSSAGGHVAVPSTKSSMTDGGTLAAEGQQSGSLSGRQMTDGGTLAAEGQQSGSLSGRQMFTATDLAKVIVVAMEVRYSTHSKYCLQ
jgi:hypothetical protein